MMIKDILRFALIAIILMTSAACEKESIPELIEEEKSDTPEPPSLYYPDEHWEEVCCAAADTWSKELLDEAEAHSATLQTAAVVIIHKGRIVRRWGEYDRKFECHSMRKSFMSALYGNYVADGTIDLDATLEDLGIDDHESLSSIEKRATVRMLLKSRSGVYHPALYETAAMAANRPARHSSWPDVRYYYNNWDFNALGTIFEQKTSKGIFEAFKTDIADPIGMQNFNPDTDGRYVTGAVSVHRAYPFLLNAMDAARFGLLFARKGKWKDVQVLPEGWVDESLTPYSDIGTGGGYGYCWRVALNGRHYPGITVPDGMASARGNGGHHITVWPDGDLVVVHRVNTFNTGNSVSATQIGRILEKILAAMPK